MDDGDDLGCNAGPASDNASPMVVFEVFSDAVCAKVAEESEILSSIPHGDDVNIVSGVGRRGLEDKEESVGYASDLSETANASMIASKLDDEIGVGKEAQKMVAGEEQDDLPGLFLLRGDGLGISPNLEADCIDKNKDCRAGEDALLVSSRSPKEAPLSAFDGDFAVQGGSFLSNKFMDVSEISTGNWMEGRCETLAVAESDNVKSDMCSGKVTCMYGRREEVNQLCSMQNVKESSVQYSRKQKEMSDRGGRSCLVILEEERIEIPHFEQEASCSVQGAPSELTHCFALVGSFSEKPSHPLASAACCSKGSAEPDIIEGNFDTFARSDGCSNGNDSRGEADGGSGTIDVFRRTNPKRGASIRSNLADEKFNQLFRIRSDRRKCRRKLSSSSFSSKLTTKIFSEVKRKRRDSERQARLSLWGALESLFHIIKQDCEFTKHDSQVTHAVRKSKKAKSGVVRRKGIPALRNGLSHLSESKRASSSRHIMVDSQAFLQNGVNHIMLTSDGHADSENFNRVFQLEQNSAGQMCNALVGSTQRSVQHGDKDLESSLTEETSVDNLPGEYYGILSKGNVKSVQETIDHKQLSDPGTSPDSLVYDPLMDVGVIISEDSVSTKGGCCGLDQKIVIQDPKTEDGLPSAAPTFIETFAAPSVSAKETHACLNPYRSKEALKESKGKKGKNGKKDNKRRKEKKGKRNGPVSEYPQTFSDHSVEAKVGSPGLNMSMKASSRSKCDLKEQQHASIEGAKCSKSVRKHSEGGLKSERCSVDSSPGLPDLACFDQSVKVKEGLETSKMPLQIVNKGQQSEAILPSDDVKGHQLSRSAKMELHEGIPSHGDSTRCRRQFKHGHHKGNRWKSDFESEDILLGENGHIDFTLKITNKLAGHGGEMGSKIDGSDALFKDTSNNTMPVSSGLSARELYHVLLDRSSLSGQKAWALCDECQKWRCIPEELVHAIENTKWTCKDNVDELFADCTIPQEKTNEVINKELEISDEEDCSTAQPGYSDTAPQRKTSARRAAWTLIKANSFLNRMCKKQTIDEIMVCYCKPPKDGGLGCHDECLNRMLNIECVKGTCPCGELCSNQQFQKRKYANFKWIKCGKKGYGLQLEEDVSIGQFLIEYVGEVLDLAAYEARLRYYASRGHKHFYFMTLNGGEVIDACGKGNLGRFINHSCDPNCRTEKWMVNGEVCIGLFAIRDIKKGEEVTFDYNYVRVFGAAAKKCVCGAAECQGYIGGDPSKSEVIVDDSAEEDLEPLMIDEDGENELAVKGTNSDATETKVIKLEDASTERGSAQWNPSSLDQGTYVQNEDTMHQPSSEPNPIDPLQHSSDCIESGHTMFITYSDIQKSQDMKLVSSSTEPDEAFCASANDDQPLCTISEPLLPGQIPDSSKDSLDSETHSIQGSILDVSTKTLQNSDSTPHKKKLITYPIEENPSTSKPFDSVKSSRPIKIKRSKANIKSVSSQKAKKVQNSMNNRHIEVEEKLNEFLNDDGGISRHKDSGKWYLKLLVVTAAAGDDIKGGLSQSARDLSLILDAILKTKSRTVLVDIINKNGLRMLHNLMKQNCDNFNRIPILRKLLKVLEFLAEKQILTLEHINGGPPCNGVESFKESMLKLRKHRDSQVHTIARNFADHWIPHTVRRFEPSDRDSRQLNSKCFQNNWAHASKFKPGHDHRKRENDATSFLTVPAVADINGEANYPSYQQVSISASLADSNLIDATRPRKRKSRWDQPSDVSTLGSQTLQSTGEAFSVFDAAIQKSGTVRTGNNSSNEAAPAVDLMQQISDDDDMPPGFGFPCLDNHPQSSCMSKDVTREVVIARTQEQYLPHLPVSFGMPIVLTQQLGTPEVEGNNQFDSSWKIAPAMPFKPFPPLPLYPRRETDWRNTGHTSNGIITALHVKNEWQ